MSAARLGLLVLVAALSIAAAGCGGDDESSAESWANDVCGNLSQWITDVDEAVRSLTAEGLNFDTDDIREAVDQAKGATEDLVDDLQELGPPDTEAGQEAQAELEDLQGVLESQVDSVEQAIDSGDGPLELAGTHLDRARDGDQRAGAGIREPPGSRSGRGARGRVQRVRGLRLPARAGGGVHLVAPLDRTYVRTIEHTFR